MKTIGAIEILSMEYYNECLSSFCRICSNMAQKSKDINNGITPNSVHLLVRISLYFMILMSMRTMTQIYFLKKIVILALTK